MSKKAKEIGASVHNHKRVMESGNYLLLEFPVYAIPKSGPRQANKVPVNKGDVSNSLVALRAIYTTELTGRCTYKTFIEARCECGHYVLKPPSDFLRAKTCGNCLQAGVLARERVRLDAARKELESKPRSRPMLKLTGSGLTSLIPPKPEPEPKPKPDSALKPDLGASHEEFIGKVLCKLINTKVRQAVSELDARMIDLETENGILRTKLLALEEFKSEFE